MRHIFLTATALTALLAFLPVVRAQTTGAAPPQVPQTIKPDQLRATQIIGASIYDSSREKVGEVQDLVVDKDGRVAMVVIDVGGHLGVGGRDVAVPFSDMKIEQKHLTLDLSAQQLDQATSFNLQGAKGSLLGTTDFGTAPH